MADGKPSRSSLANDPRARGLVYQGLLAAALVALLWMGWRNAVVNMQARGIPMGFGFWDEIAGFDINQSLIDYSALSTYGRAFWVGLLNTLMVGAICIALATPLGFAVGVARLSPNWILSKVALVYVELMRNTPLLLQLAFWYNAVLKTLPGPRQSLSFGGFVFLNNRGLYLPRPLFGAGAIFRRRRARAGASRRAGVRRLGAPAPGVERRALARRARRAPRRRRPADARLFRGRRADRLFLRSAFRLQPQRRAAALSGIRGADLRARHLHRRLHRRDRARGRARGAARPERGGAGRSGSIAR